MIKQFLNSIVNVVLHAPTQVLGVAAIVAYLIVTLPAYFQSDHVFRNLEPYPDGLLYTTSARNLIQHGRLQMVYRDSVLPFWVSPLYSYVLAVGYLVDSNPDSFYLTNVVLGITSVWLLFTIVSKTTDNKVISFVSALLFLLHGYILLLPSLPLAENLSILLFIAALFILFATQQSLTQKTSLLILIALAMAYTKSAAIPISGGLLGISLFFVIQSLVKQNQHFWLKIIGSLLVISTGLLIYRDEAIINQVVTVLYGENQFFAPMYIFPNLRSYIEILAFQQGKFLWWSTPLTSWLLLVIFFVTPLYAHMVGERKATSRSILLLALFLTQFPLLLFFYAKDARYVIYTIPLLIIQFSWLLRVISRHTMSAVILGSVTILLIVIQQIPLYRELLSANIFGRSNAWQYQSIRHFDLHLNSGDDSTYLITALPPFLVDTYSNEHYRVLPLSYDQEFLQKKEYVWGNDIEYTDIKGHFVSLVESSQQVYISNAYVTHQQSVIEDYEMLKQDFQFSLVSEGCLGACNIYKLSNINDTSTN